MRTTRLAIVIGACALPWHWAYAQAVSVAAGTTTLPGPVAVVAPSVTTADITNIVNVLLGLASAAVLAAIPILVPAVLKRLGIANNAAMEAKVDQVGDDAAGAAYQYALAHEGGLGHVEVKNAALAAGLSHLNANAGAEMTALGVTPAAAAGIVSAKLGALLATDPSISAGAPAQIPTPALVPAPIPVHVIGQPATLLADHPGGLLTQAGATGATGP
jgi:hypothetical protein